MSAEEVVRHTDVTPPTPERSEVVFRALVDAAPCLMIITRLDYTILYFNRFAERVTGYTAAEVLGKNALALLRPHLPEEPLGEELTTEFEVPIRAKNGSERWLLCNTERLPSFNGEPALVIVGLDRTELKEVQRRAWQAEQLAELGILASGLAHEIRNPLNSIRFNLLNVQDLVVPAAPLASSPLPSGESGRNEEAAGEVGAILRDIAAEVDRLEGIVRDFLRLARPEPSQIERIDPGELLESVVRLVEGPCRSQNIELGWEHAAPAVVVAADGKQLKQVLLNLILNAQQAMPEGGRLTLRSYIRDDQFLIEVTDTGAGIPPEIRPKIFQPFFSTKKEGTGLGLNICRRLIEQMGGAIDFESEVGRGTTFRITLPVVPQTEGR
ncbi:MAG TPA: ATP-binding protein [Gemmataceae bacterium]|nr:ATP-binding protein [Gemmataceae bacterium]